MATASPDPRPDDGARFDLIETMAFDPVQGLALLERHLARMKDSAAALGFVFDRHAARNELQAATFRLRATRRVRLLLARSGALAVEVGPLPPPPAAWAVAIVPLPADDLHLRHRTSDRRLQDTRIAAGAPEVVFETPDGMLAGGSFAAPFVERDGRLLTPPLAQGVLRAELIETGRAVEAPLIRADLAGGFLLGDAVHGLVPAFVAVAKEPAPPL